MLFSLSGQTSARGTGEGVCICWQEKGGVSFDSPALRAGKILPLPLYLRSGKFSKSPSPSLPAETPWIPRLGWPRMVPSAPRPTAAFP